MQRVSACVLSGLRTTWPMVVSSRSTWVMKRTRKPHPVPVERATQDYINQRAWRRPLNKNQTYEGEEVETIEPIRLILVQNTEDFGNKGQVLTLYNPRLARDELLLTGAAVYASEENLEKYKDILIPEETRAFSSPTVEMLLIELRRLVVPACVNMHNPWTLKPFHVHVFFHRVGLFVPEESIELPEEEISGPNADYESKEFAVFIKVNKTERIPVRCVLHHLSTDPSENKRVWGWQFLIHEPILESQRSLLDSMPRPKFGKNAAMEPAFDGDKDKLKQWRIRRDKELAANRDIR